jgi:hypothetical protein
VAEKVKPIRPEEVGDQQMEDFPDAVFEAFNEMIAANNNQGHHTFKVKDVVALMVKKGLKSKEIHENGWLDIEAAYKKAGWDVEYDGPAYNETYNATFTFKSRKKK